MGRALKTDFVSGLVVLLPLLVTSYVLLWVFRAIAGFPLVEYVAPELPIISDVSEQLALVISILLAFGGLLFVIGWLMRTAAGRLTERAIDAGINQIPGFRVVYNASKIAVETAVNDFGVQEPVRVELWGAFRLTGFRTGKQTSDGREIVFVPTSPNVTSGFVIEVAEADISPTGESVETALSRVLSAGFGDQDDKSEEAIEAFETIIGDHSNSDQQAD